MSAVLGRAGAVAGVAQGSGSSRLARRGKPQRLPPASLSSRPRPLGISHGHSCVSYRAKSRESVPLSYALMPSDSMSSGDEDPSDGDSSDEAPETINPRRTTSMTFTCNQCGGRTERRVNPVALAKGLVFVQCGECEVWHKVADNQGLIVEYDLRNEE